MVDIVFVLDESLSMNRYSQAYIKSINKFITTQKVFNPKGKFTMVKFNTEVKCLCLDREICSLPEFKKSDYYPNGVTTMYDAIGKAISLKVGQNVKNVIMFILTDGSDNNSKIFDKKQIADKISDLKSFGWSFVYIATDKAAQKIGSELCIEKCVTYKESDKSIDYVADACNIAVGHAMYRWTGVNNQYSNKKVPTDVSELMNNFASLSL